MRYKKKLDRHIRNSFPLLDNKTIKKLIAWAYSLEELSLALRFIQDIGFLNSTFLDRMLKHPCCGDFLSIFSCYQILYRPQHSNNAVTKTALIDVLVASSLSSEQIKNLADALLEIKKHQVFFDDYMETNAVLKEITSHPHPMVYASLLTHFTYLLTPANHARLREAAKNINFYLSLEYILKACNPNKRAVITRTTFDRIMAYSDFFSHEKVVEFLAHFSSKQINKPLLESWLTACRKFHGDVEKVDATTFSPCLKALRRLVKVGVMAKSATVSSKDYPLQSSLYCGSQLIKEDILTQIEQLYAAGPILQLLIKIMMLTSKKIPHDTKNKSLRILLMEYPQFRTFNHNPNILGTYRNKNSIFVHINASLLDNKKTLATLLHEATHFAINKAFKNACYPYKNNDPSTENHVARIIENIRAKLPTLPQTTPAEIAAHFALLSVFKEYDPKQYAVEFAVKVPEILALLGYNEGLLWLTTHAFELLAFYQLIINPALAMYIIEYSTEIYKNPSDPLEENGLLANEDRGLVPEVSMHKM